MAYLVLARKYRSQTFSEVLGQEHVTQTLQNAILSGRLAHAILFCGPRGTGKTSIARILAKSMNCGQGPTTTPCNQCRSCMEITAGHGVDVMEIDGASNNSVDQIRDLREGLGYAPAHSPYRIYIIDEVHMLSTAAFNALLKTLEEPPGHILFFFATTEAHKIPLTILSRCQRHDLRRIGTESLRLHLGEICRKEGVEMEDEALDMVAREADGSVRDALSLLDRVIAGLSGEKGGREAVGQILGLASRSQAFQMGEALFTGNAARVITLVWDLHQAGIDLKKFHGDLCLHMRNLLVAKMRTPDFQSILDLPDAAVRDLVGQAASLPEFYIGKILDTLMTGENTLRYAANPRLSLETLLLKCLRIQAALSMDVLVEKLDLLQKTLLHPPLPELACSRDVQTSETERNPVGTGERKALQQAPSSEDLPLLSGKEGGKKPPETGTSEAIQKTIQPEKIETSRNSIREEGEHPPEEVYRDFLPPDTETDEDPDLGEMSPDFIAHTEKKMAEKGARWKQLIMRLREKSPSLGELFATRVRLKKRTDQRMEIEVHGSGFSVARLNEEKNIRLVETLIEEIYGNPLHLVLHADRIEDAEILKKKSEMEGLRNNARTHMLVQDALEVFKGEIVDVTFLMEDL